jgi:Transmembrane amino acid transporter protein
MLGSISIAVNSLTGPAMLSLPATFARSGIIPTIATLLFVCILSALCSLHMANSISKVPGNATFKKEVEFSEVFRIFGGQRWFLVTQVLFLCCITCLNISSIVDTVQVVDTVAGIWWPGGSAAIHIQPFGMSRRQGQRALRDDIAREHLPAGGRKRSERQRIRDFLYEGTSRRSGYQQKESDDDVEFRGQDSSRSSRIPKDRASEEHGDFVSFRVEEYSYAVKEKSGQRERAEVRDDDLGFGDRVKTRRDERQHQSAVEDQTDDIDGRSQAIDRRGARHKEPAAEEGARTNERRHDDFSGDGEENASPDKAYAESGSITEQPEQLVEEYSSGGVSSEQPSQPAAEEVRPLLIRWVRWDYSACSTDDIKDGKCLPFSDESDGLLFTAGKLISTLAFMPLALLDLKENSWWQVVGFIVLVITSFFFIVQFVAMGLEPGFLTWWGYDWDALLGVVLFNFSLVIAIPAWLYEREPHVDVPTVIHGSSCLVVILYIAIGMLGAMALPHVSDNMLESMILGAEGLSMQLGASLFAVAIVGLGIPLFSVITRLNLTSSGMSLRMGNLLSVYLPFAVAWILNDGKAVTTLLGWGGVIFTSLVAFILPLGLALYVAEKFDEKGTILVYGNYLKDRISHAHTLRILLLLAALSIIVAIVGNFVGVDG